jgi:hypothetical protein
MIRIAAAATIPPLCAVCPPTPFKVWPKPKAARAGQIAGSDPPLPNEPHWLPSDVVIAHNRLETQATGEPHFLRDRGLLESAMPRSRNFYSFGEEEVLVLGVVLMAGIAWAHAFKQGNKRSAFEALWHFLRIKDTISPSMTSNPGRTRSSS